MNQLVLILLIFTFSSCESTWYNDYKVKNDTKYLIEINAFDTDKEVISNLETIKIQPYSSYAVLKANGFHLEYQGLFHSSEIDSVTISFNNSRISIQSCEYGNGASCQFSRNIMNYSNESDFVKTKRGRSQGHKEYTFTYTITNEDYNNAVPIGSD